MIASSFGSLTYKFENIKFISEADSIKKNFLKNFQKALNSDPQILTKPHHKD